MPEEGTSQPAQPARPVSPVARPLDIGDQLAAQICLLGMQQVSDNSRLAQNTLLAFQKDLFQGGQAEVTSAMAAMRASRMTTTGS